MNSGTEFICLLGKSRGLLTGPTNTLIAEERNGKLSKGTAAVCISGTTTSSFI